MTLPCHSFPASRLPLQIQVNVDGKRRKTDGGKPIDLSACELLDLVQYQCKVEHPKQRDSPIRCWPVQRWFRRCQDKKGSFMVETTAWEGTHAATNTTTATIPSPDPNMPTHWHDANKTDYYAEGEL
ncbi:hypothetical protein N0V93_000570 [Gnomoniopsis smithogilvyi]|uniref:Uncharacterized protein n=1 Tax=Gnomoniopsis smithogilvyi TaxID=1191159 RepID=A0A9W9D1V8_9PEZI|nr:hypothetical protein N0V93_000570 [Gnomoniopsis smithogilvyi]